MGNEPSPTVVIPLMEEHLDVAWDAEGAEWEEHLQRSLKERLGSFNSYNEWHGPPAEPHVWFDFQITKPPIPSILRLVPQDEGAQALLVGPAATIDQDKELWLHAVQTATGRVGVEHPEFSWFSLLTCEPVFGATTQVLKGDARVGNLRLTPSGVMYCENQADRAKLDGVSLLCSSPVIVEGSDCGFNFESAGLTANRRLATLRNILSVALDSRWTIKLSPLDRKIDIPESNPWIGPREPESLALPRDTVTLPEWLDQAWDRVTNEKDLRDCLAIYQEALDLWRDHPSLALVSFVAAAERMGERLHPLKRCNCCQRCSVMVGAGKRFRAALGVVLSKEELAPLADAYTPRSETVHSGSLHGSELTLGAAGLGITQTDPSIEFEMGLVDRLRRATRAILSLALRGELRSTVPPNASESSR